MDLQPKGKEMDFWVALSGVILEAAVLPFHLEPLVAISQAMIEKRAFTPLQS